MVNLDQARMLVLIAVEDFCAAIGTAVVNTDNFIILMGLFDEAVEISAQIILYIVYGDNCRNLHWASTLFIE